MNRYVTDSDGSGFLEITPIYNLNRYKGRFIYKTNLPLSKFNIDDYLDDYILEYRKYQRKYKNKKNVEGYRAKYLLPLDVDLKNDKKKIAVLANSLIEFISPANKIPYFAYVSKGAKGTKFLSIILLDRYYFPNGRVIRTERPNTRIVDAQGKIVAKSEYDPKKHTIMWNKGDEFEKRIVMSDKIRLDDIFTQGINTEMFVSRIAHIKKKLLYEVNRIFGLKIVYVKKFLKKLTYKQRLETKTGWIHVDKRQIEYDKQYYYRRRKVRHINAYIESANEMLSTVLCQTTANKIADKIATDVNQAKKLRMVADVEKALDMSQIITYFI